MPSVPVDSILLLQPSFFLPWFDLSPLFQDLLEHRRFFFTGIIDHLNFFWRFSSRILVGAQSICHPCFCPVDHCFLSFYYCSHFFRASASHLLLSFLRYKRFVLSISIKSLFQIYIDCLFLRSTEYHRYNYILFNT